MKAKRPLLGLPPRTIRTLNINKQVDSSVQDRFIAHLCPCRDHRLQSVRFPSNVGTYTPQCATPFPRATVSPVFHGMQAFDCRFERACGIKGTIAASLNKACDRWLRDHLQKGRICPPKLFINGGHVVVRRKNGEFLRQTIDVPIIVGPIDMNKCETAIEQRIICLSVEEKRNGRL